MILKSDQKILPKWYKCSEGSTAIEFALLSVPFAILLIGIIEVSLLLAHSSILEGSVQDAARKIRTGAVQRSQDPEETFRTALCGHGVLLDCDKIQYRVYVLGRFSEAQESPPEYDNEGNLIDEEFDVGGASSIIRIQVSYMHTLMTPLVGQYFAQYPGNRRLLSSNVVLQSEPYEFD
jgi:Flp pilus assembly pilin Flp